MDNAKINRRTFVIDRGFQLKYTLLLVGAGTFVSLLFGGMMYLTQVNAARGVTVPDAVRIELARSESSLLLLMATVSVLMAGALALFGLLITHRVAGPVYVMSHYITVLANGRYPIMRQLRKSDELRDFFQRFQDALEALRRREIDEAVNLEEAVGVFRPLAGTPEGIAALDRLDKMAKRKRDATDKVEPATFSAERPAA